MATTYEQILGIEGDGANKPQNPSLIPGVNPDKGNIAPTPGKQQNETSTPTSQIPPPPPPTNPPAQPRQPQQSAQQGEQKTENPTPTQQPEQPQQRVLSYEEMFRILNPEKPETPEEKAKREKKEKREAIFAAIGDGISALSNLYFTTKGAPNAYDPTQGMSAKARERWDRLNAKRDADRRAYSEGLLRAMQLDDANRKDERNWKHTIEREKISDERYEVKAAQDKAMADLNEKLKQQQITGAEYDAEYKRIRAQYAPQQEEAELKRKKAAAGASNASANSSNARADYYRNGGNGGGRKGPTLQLEDDEPMHFNDDKDYDRTVMRLAPEYGVPTTTVEITEKDRKGNPKKQRTVQRPVKDIAADIEREAAKRKKNKSDNKTMPGVGGGQQSSTTMPGVK